MVSLVNRSATHLKGNVSKRSSRMGSNIGCRERKDTVANVRLRSRFRSPLSSLSPLPVRKWEEGPLKPYWKLLHFNEMLRKVCRFEQHGSLNENLLPHLDWFFFCQRLNWKGYQRNEKNNAQWQNRESLWYVWYLFNLVFYFTFVLFEYLYTTYCIRWSGIGRACAEPNCHDSACAR